VPNENSFVSHLCYAVIIITCGRITLFVGTSPAGFIVSLNKVIAQTLSYLKFVVNNTVITFTLYLKMIWIVLI